MAKTRALAAVLLATVMIGSASIAAVAQDEAPGPEGVDWQLTEYAVDAALIAVPEGITATLLLKEGQASGSGGCNSFFGSYVIDGQSLDFGEAFGRTEIFCEGDPQVVEDAYLAALPATTSWSIEEGALRLFDAEDAAVLVFASTATENARGDINAVVALVDFLQNRIAALETRIVDLEGAGESADGGNQTVKKIRKPKAPTVRGGKVETTLPEYMRDELRPESERSADKNRELVKWRNRSSDVDGLRIYARRRFCALKDGADVSKELKDRDFRAERGRLLQIAELPAGTKRYRPRHDAINEALPAAPDSPYSSDQYYDVLVSAFNTKGESKKTLVGSYLLTPTFDCP
ncbi:MAG: META domain-containing protein [Chloroflexota bacterium]